MHIKILPINIEEEKIHKILFPPDGNYIRWIQTNNPNIPQFEKNNTCLQPFYRKHEDSLVTLLIVPKIYESQIQNYLKNNDGFGNYQRIYLEVDVKLLLQYTSTSVSIIRDVKGEKNPSIHIFIDLINTDEIIKDWIEAGMPEPWI